MNKIVITKNIFFALSARNQVEYLKMLGKEAYFYFPEFGNMRLFHKIPVDKINIDSGPNYAFTKDFGESFVRTKEHWKYEFDVDKIARDDKNLIFIAENGDNEYLGELKVIEIPDDVEWEICPSKDNRGELVAEVHRTWE